MRIKEGTLKKYVHQVVNNASPGRKERYLDFVLEQIELYLNGVRDIRMSDEALVILSDGIEE